MRLRLRAADVGGELEVVTDQGEPVEGIVAVQMNFDQPGLPQTMVKIRIFPDDVLVDEDTAKTREMRVVGDLSDSRRYAQQNAQRRVIAEEEVHEHKVVRDQPRQVGDTQPLPLRPKPLGDYGGSE